MEISQVAFQSASPVPVANGGGSAGGSSPVSGQVVSVVSGAVPPNTDASTSAAGRHAPSAEQLAQAVSQVNDAFSKRGQDLYAAFDKDKATGISVVKIVDKNTKEVISQIPSKEIMGLAQSLDQPSGKGGQLMSVKA